MRRQKKRNKQIKPTSLCKSKHIIKINVITKAITLPEENLYNLEVDQVYSKHLGMRN